MLLPFLHYSKPHAEYTCHPHCGAATYLYVENGGVIPITRLGDVDKFFTDLSLSAKDLRKDQAFKAKLRLGLYFISYINPKIMREVLPAILTGNYESLKPFHYKTLMIGMMHFMDPYNFDVNRMQMCTIHYVFPGGKIIPFRTMNSIHRQRLEKLHSVPINEKEHNDAGFCRISDWLKLIV